MTQRLARHATNLLILATFLALMGFAGWVEGL